MCAVLVESHRIDGKPRQQTVAYALPGLRISEQSSGRDAASFKAREWALVWGVAAYRQEPRRPCAAPALAVKRVV